ncbi:MAG: Nucleoside 5-triphosphatase RdgB (dHAPTP, dITP, XTP-specific) [Ignavibacteriae bacterium]|nr:MAG: Nucleoside 5-triphosphatase RdgB (dHAPTP, dITP, XTP-specific) [Ignavibacteriota bacterium]
MRTLVIATRNKGKVKEIKAIFSDLNVDIIDLNNFKDIPEIYEDGETFEANALKKAREVYGILKLPVLSDDSGLEVEFLNNQPGVLSARFAGEPTNFANNNAKLLKLLENVPDVSRKARFRCVVVFKTEEKEEIAEGICSGKIIEQLRGTGGFGYDPLFIPDGFNLTFAEMPQELKNKISHRAQALNKIKPFIVHFFNKI